MKVKVRLKNKKKTPILQPTKVTTSKKHIIKEWLCKKQIRFKTVFSLLTTIVSLFLSILALKNSYQTIQNEEKLSMPLFNATSKYTHEQINIDGLSYPEQSSVKHEITNQGGNLTAGEGLAFEMLYIIVHDSEYNTISTIKIQNFDHFINSFSRYDSSTKSFTFYERLTTDIDLHLGDYVHDQLKQKYPDYSFSIYTINHAKLTYFDYKGILHTEWYDLYDGRIVDDPENDNMFSHSWSADMTVESIYELIAPSIDQALEKLSNVNIQD